MKKRIISSFATSILFCVVALAQDLVPMHNDKGQFGYGIKGSKEFAIKPKWDEAKPFNDKGIAIVRKDKSFGMIDKNGKAVGKSMGYSLITPFDGTDLFLIAEGGNRVEDVSKIKTRQSISPYGFRGTLSYPIKDAKWGLVRPDGTFQIEPKYQEISNQMEGGLLIIQQKGLLGIIDTNGNPILEPLYDAMTPINNQGIAAIRNKKTQKWSLIAKDGHTIIGEDNNISSFYQFRNNYWGNLNCVNSEALLKNHSMWAEIDRMMPIMTFGPSWVNSDHNYIAAERITRQKKKNITELAIFDLDGNEIIPFSAGLTYSFVPSEGMSVAYRNDKCGFYNTGSRTFTPVETKTYLPFKNGLSLSYSMNNSNYCFVDKNGDRKSDIYDMVSVVNERFIVTKGSRQGLVTLSGDVVIPVECLEVRDANDGIFAVRDNSGAFGYLNQDGDIVIPLEYADGGRFINGHTLVSKKVPGTMKTVYGAINLKNDVIIPMEYEKAVMWGGKDGSLNVWVKKDGVFNQYNLSTSRLTPTNYMDMKSATFGVVTKNAQGNFGLIIGDEEIIPCSLGDEEAVGSLYSYMLSNNIPTVSSSEARSIAIRLNPDRNKFKLGEKISENFWDF